MRILFAVSLAEPTEAVRMVEGLCNRLNADLYVLHVDEPLRSDLSVLDPAGFDSPLYSYSLYDPEIAEELEHLRGTVFEAFLQRNFERPIQTMLRESGDPATLILAELDRIGAEILVMGRKHRPFLERLVVGSVSSKVIKEASVPILLVPIDEG